ncbi:hypothetical protein HP398_29655 [Brevibacillus sp. HB1.4B]|uniref:hypothetical protein n=1 Tax=Brevibacillus sp. HB1.4B TaxID=2738845 RepID=UPI00156BAAD2|nr:hypothetical protein [Brevibacillus sp. HB1.4B]NRS20588.1 hypothetical protein [Brevibacillus sp. HB1.4B]
MAKIWNHRDLIEDVFDIDDLLDAHEMMEVEAENSRRAKAAAELQGGGMLP